MQALRLTSLALALALAGGHAGATTFTAAEILGPDKSYTFKDGLVDAGATGFHDSFTLWLASGINAVTFLFNIAQPGSAILPSSFSVSHLGNSVQATGGNVVSSYSSTDEDGFTSNFSLLNKSEYTFTLADLADGLLTIDVSGQFASPFSTAKNYSLTVSAVPEPESGALFLTALGLLAGFARRNATIDRKEGRT